MGLKTASGPESEPRIMTLFGGSCPQPLDYSALLFVYSLNDTLVGHPAILPGMPGFLDRLHSSLQMGLSWLSLEHSPTLC